MVGRAEARNSRGKHMGSRNRFVLCVQDKLPQAIVGRYRPGLGISFESRSVAPRKRRLSSQLFYIFGRAGRDAQLGSRTISHGGVSARSRWRKAPIMVSDEAAVEESRVA
jgi:hypothetical protein